MQGGLRERVAFRESDTLPLERRDGVSGISRSICQPMLATRARRSVSWWSSCRSRTVDSRASKIYLTWPGSRSIRGSG